MKNCIVLFLFLFGWCYSILSQPQYTFKRLTMSDGMVSNYIVDIIQDKQGYIWMASESGLCKFDGKDFTIYNIGNSAIGSNAQNVLYYNEADNTVWVGTQRDGISIFDCEKQTFITNGVPDMITRDVTDLSPAADGGIWITHYHLGIDYYDNKTKEVTHYWAKDIKGFSGNFWCAADDGKGHLYVGLHKGGLAVIDIQKQTAKVYQHDPEDPYSLPNNTVRCIFISKSYGNSDPSSKGTLAPIVDGKVDLSYQNSTFTVSFSVMDFSQTPQVEYAYTMEGLGKTWFETGDENRITFRNLQPGEYTFKVKAKMRNQPWGEKFTSLQITITPPIWLTWYAKLLYTILIVFILFATLRFYKRKLALESRLNLEHHQHENDQKLNNERLRFYTNITHELRTPLTLILGPLEDLLADKTLSPRQANKISIIRDSANRLLNLINQILEFRKTETENRKLKVGYHNLALLVQEIGIKYKELNQNAEVNIHINVETQDTKIYYDHEIITIIIDNLMSNALKYTPKGDITLALASNEENGVKYTTISVEDTGHGISQESLNHIFERYYQGQGKYQASGSGIGLALVKSLADLHQATIEVESEVEKGSKFTLKLLTENTYPNAERQVTKEVHKSEDENKQPASVESEDGKPIILVVEDNRDIREYVRSSFEEMYEVLTAADGKEGWDIAQSQIPNIISDIMMPVMDGIELCRHIKEDMRTSHIPVILLTAKDTLQDKEEGYAAGADSFITKPFSARLLNSRINNILENRRKTAGVITSIPETESEQKNIENERKNLNKLDQEFLDKVTTIIEENLSMEKMDVAFIADKMCMSHSTLYRKIKGLTEMSVNEYVRKIKMKKGMELINEGKYSLAEISDLTGFNSVAYFRQCFKDEYGMAPTEYLKRKQN